MPYLGQKHVTNLIRISRSRSGSPSRPSGQRFDIQLTSKLTMDLQISAIFAIIAIVTTAPCRCRTKCKVDVRVRLAGGIHPREGRVEVYFNKTWGTICDNDFDKRDAAVICKMLGFSGVARALPSLAVYGSGKGPIWIDHLGCNGFESTIAQCAHAGWGVANCTHSEDAAVICYGESNVNATVRPPTDQPTRNIPVRLPTNQPTWNAPARPSTNSLTSTPPSTATLPPRICNTPDPNIILKGGRNEAEGLVLIRYQGQWGHICDDGWGQEEAHVVCRQLCYQPTNARAYLAGNATYRYWLDDMKCRGDEARIQDCPASPFGANNCNAAEAAGVSCLPDLTGPTLVDISSHLVPVPTPEVTCDDERIFAKFSRALDRNLIPQYLSLPLAHANYPFLATSDTNFVYVSIPFVTRGCNTIRERNATFITYRNTIRYDIPDPGNVITRNSAYSIVVSCALPRDSNPDNNIQPIPRTAPPAMGDGQFDVRLLLYTDSSFTNPITRFPAPVLLGDYIYVSVVLVTLDLGLKVVVPQCKATPDPDPSSQPEYYLIDNKCGTESSVTFNPINETVFNYRFQTFKFLRESSPLVYIHCMAYICEVSEKNSACDRSCSLANSGRRRRHLIPESSSDKERLMSLSHVKGVVEVDGGPIVLVDPDIVPLPEVGQAFSKTTGKASSLFNIVSIICAMASSLILTLVLH